MQTFFTISELTVSQAATRKGIDNTPTAEVLLRLNDLIDHILVPVRMHFAKPVIISSGYRSPKVNKSVGGAATSQHCFGEAADFTVHGVADLEVAEWIKANLPFDQLIMEFPPEGWVHCSYSSRHRGEVLTAKRINGKTVYINGLHP